MKLNLLVCRWCSAWKEVQANSRGSRPEVLPEGHPNFEANYQYVERIVKFLLWQRGGHTLYVGGSPKIADHLKNVYSANGARNFDYKFMGEQVYEKEFSIISCDVDEVPASRETGKLLGRNLNGQPHWV